MDWSHTVSKVPMFWSSGTSNSKTNLKIVLFKIRYMHKCKAELKQAWDKTYVNERSSEACHPAKGLSTNINGNYIWRHFIIRNHTFSLSIRLFRFCVPRLVGILYLKIKKYFSDFFFFAKKVLLECKFYV